MREMNKNPIRKHNIAAAQRGLIVQRVLVEGWTPEEAGRPFGVDGRLAARWVAAYRRDGMTALRGDAAFEGGPFRWIDFCLRWVGARMRDGILVAAGRPTLRHPHRGGAPEDPTRRQHWN